MDKTCRSCGGPLSDFTQEELIHPDFCPMCVNSRGDLRDYKEILDNMIEYIKNDHPEIRPENRQQEAVSMLREGPVWGNEFKGIIVEESLTRKDVLKRVTIVNTEITENSNPKTNGGFVIWQIHTVTFYRTELDEILHSLSESMRDGGWWCDISFGDEVYVVFKDKIFAGSKKDQKFRDEVDAYANAKNIPVEQFPFKNIT